MLQDQDQYGTEARAGYRIRGQGPCRRDIFVDCGHSVHRDQPDVTLAACCRFLGLSHFARDSLDF